MARYRSQARLRPSTRRKTERACSSIGFGRAACARTRRDLDLWAKDVAPSNALRRWFGHRPERWEEFAKRYRAELAAPEAQPQVEALRAMSRKSRVTLLYAARDESMNNAVVLRDYLRKRH